MKHIAKTLSCLGTFLLMFFGCSVAMVFILGWLMDANLSNWIMTTDFLIFSIIVICSLILGLILLLPEKLEQSIEKRKEKAIYDKWINRPPS